MLVNLTPHPITVVGIDGSIISEIPPSGTVARLAENVTPAGEVDGIPAVRVALWEGLRGLPEPVEGTTYIVSTPALMGARAGSVTRTDLVYPFGQVRDESGRIVGCRSLATIATGYAHQDTRPVGG